MKFFGNRLRAAMKAAGLSASDLARLCERPPQTVGKWHKMREADLKAKHAACAAEVTGVNLVRLITGNGARKRRSK
jgi:transcriptional regulator with XRE-family HTH domain